MRLIAWAALGAGLAGLLSIGGSASAVADGMYGYGGARYSYRSYRPSRAVRPAPRAQRYYYRGYRPYRSCGQFKYRSDDGRCLDARTNPPDLD